MQLLCTQQGLRTGHVLGTGSEDTAANVFLTWGKRVMDKDRGHEAIKPSYQSGAVC